MIASVHIQVNLPKLNRIKKYHSIARAIRTCLHAYGIHSSTIQPEFADKPINTTGGEEVEALDAEEDTPLLEGESQKGCLFECVGGGECADNRCCDGGDGQTTVKGKKNGTGGYGTGGGNS
jgi:zinc transporter 1